MSEPFEALDKHGWMEFSGNYAPKCPHCGEVYSIRDEEAWHLYSEDELHEVSCSSCNKPFQVTSSATWTFSTDEQERP